MPKRKCDECSKEYSVRQADLDRGWGKCCSKSCSAKKREKSKPNYNPERVAINNVRRVLWNDNPKFVEENHYGKHFGGLSSEGYKKFQHEGGTDKFTAVNEYGEAVYDDYNWMDDEGDSEYWEGKD